MGVRAAVLTGPGALGIETFPDPDLGPGDALIRMELSGICGTDKHIFSGEGHLYAGTEMESQAAFPLIPGHENVGVIEELGATAGAELDFYGQQLRVGDRVVMCPDVVCGSCWYCKHGRMLWCVNARCYGVTLTSKNAPHLYGGWAEKMVLRRDAFTYKVPEGLSAALAVLVEPLVVTQVLDEARGHSAIGGEGFRGGDTMVIQGAGALGLMFTLRGRIMGAGEIIVIDDSPERLDRARVLGASHTLALGATTAEERLHYVRELTGGRGADVVVDCAGVPAALPEGLELARKGATYIETGAYVDTGSVLINPHKHLCSKSIRLIGATNHAYTGYGPALKMLQQYGESAGFAHMVTHTIPFTNAEEAIRTSLLPAAGKVLVSGSDH